MIQQFHWWYIPKGNEITNLVRYRHTYVHCSIITIFKIWKLSVICNKMAKPVGNYAKCSKPDTETKQNPVRSHTICRTYKYT